MISSFKFDTLQENNTRCNGTVKLFLYKLREFTDTRTFFSLADP